MTQVSMTSPAGVTLATAGKYCEDNVKVTPLLQSKAVTPGPEQQVVAADAGNAGLSAVTVAGTNSKMWSVTLAAAVSNNGRTLFVTDSWLAAHRTDENLFVAVCFKASIADVSGTFQVLWVGGNVPYFTNSSSQTSYGTVMYRNASGTASYAARFRPLYQERAAAGGMFIDGSGSLYLYGMGNQPLPAGEYTVMAWLG